ncbi:hypothetical protein EG68_00172 [Paragonimus skrjabini miyazakii]|uniref:Uncharacterized protein n=1 Tax=Paragonimus skrjabini miyazakii TaxID=59628 RepID=A0A8S9Z9Y8_9TREM|nr:hypothetical protein EG68_00172 [Paragonimus skrjabini miyazakii]
MHTWKKHFTETLTVTQHSCDETTDATASGALPEIVQWLTRINGTANRDVLLCLCTSFVLDNGYCRRPPVRVVQVCVLSGTSYLHVSPPESIFPVLS